jgi:aspartate aminotransferase-like enzyme
MMQRLGLDVTVLECPWGEGADEARLDAVLKADTDKKIKAVCVVHNETTTGAYSYSHPHCLAVRFHWWQLQWELFMLWVSKY